MNPFRLSIAILSGLIVFFLHSGCLSQEAEEVLKAVVRIRSVISPEARTAGILGTERQGSGVVIDEQGHILTIGYLILEADTIEVTDAAGKQVKASYIGYDHDTGFGILRAHEALHIRPMALGTSADIKVGDPVLVAGYGKPEAVTGVRVASRTEFAGYWEYYLDDAIYTIPPYQEFGGAALIGRGGRLVGIGSLLIQVDIAGMGSVSSNLFVPIDYLKPILNNLIRTGRSGTPSKPWLGVNLEEAHGRVFVVRITGESPAETAGLQPGDLIVMVGSQEVKGLSDFYRKLWALGKAGVRVPLRILRGADIQEIVIRSGDRQQFLMTTPKRKF